MLSASPRSGAFVEFGFPNRGGSNSVKRTAPLWRERAKGRVRVVTSYGEPVREEGGKEGARATGC